MTDVPDLITIFCGMKGITFLPFIPQKILLNIKDVELDFFVLILLL